MDKNVEYQFTPQPEKITDSDVHFGWFLPTWGDTAAFGVPSAARPRTLSYFVKVAQAAEDAGMEYSLVPVQVNCYEAWITCAMVVANTVKLKALVAARPQFFAPSVMAKMITTFDQLSGGRVLINLIAGGDKAEMLGDGDFIRNNGNWELRNHDQRYEIMDESCDIMRQLWTSEEPINYDGKWFHLENSIVQPRPFQQPYPAFYLGGLSPAAKEVSAKHVNVFLLWGDTHEKIAEEIADVRHYAAKHGRENEVRCGMRLQVIVRETEEEAWDAAWGLIEHATDAQRNRAGNTWQESQANLRVRELTKQEGFRLTCNCRRCQSMGGCHLWAGIATVRPGAGVSIVGNPEQVAETIRGFMDIGCSDFCLSGYPHDEAAEYFGRLVTPQFKKMEPIIRPDRLTYLETAGGQDAFKLPALQG